LSYGIGTSLRPSSFEPNTTLSISAIFAPENVSRLRSGVQEEVERVVRDGFGAQEVADAKRALLQERRLARSRDAALAAALTDQAYVDRTFAYSGEVDRAIEALTPEQVTDTFRRRLKADAFAFVFAGDFAKKKK
jgi:zinc protease